ncbi:DNA polymerase ligase N-terminal domain-containing protein [Nocardioides sp. YIM 152315]|uniref:DNA polymerase ligase N-terminal domain-containing protein n=1 Tax=Nocardioides sp. YIM 152315 TaxID=3031760 RepID=UPI0023DBB6B6|nr:DNA polymerase ligase N-terminal domain-containing protein [Nocardioides sp. YIM 152315]MDF1602911.1 DNA polymerase ligase N-terminal domain-containing protein [Nocardioides sp. YIM 152315]
MSKDRLSTYRGKRDTGASGEPAGHRRRGHREAIFVVQRHDASSLHFDFRLEVDGVLASWAVPKGPSLDPRDKRLAVQVEDHPLDYADFEGRIGEGYGEGTVIVWDTGTFDNVTERKGEPVDLADAIDAGHVKVALHGEKLTGAFALTHTRMGGDEKNWMLVKVDDDGADRRRKPTSTQNESVLSGRTNEDL